MTNSKPHFVFLSDAPPIESSGFGNSAVAFSFAKALGDDIGILFTRQHHWRNSRSAIGAGLKSKIVVFLDLSWVRGLRALSPILRSLLDSAFFLLQIPWLIRASSRYSPARIFALCGNDPFFLLNALAFARFSRLPLDFYMVDDFEASASMEGKKTRAKIFGWIEGLLLPQVDRIFVISNGYAKLLRKKYGLASTVLPVPVRYPKIVYSDVFDNNNSRTIAFSGSVNALYISALRDLCEVLCDRNRGGESWELLFLGKASKEQISALIGNYSFIKTESPVNNPALVERLSGSSACFLPYSDSQDHAIRTMVQTAFPCKISEYFASGRPIFAYAPRNSSITEYFEAQKLPFCFSTKAELARGLSKFEDYDFRDLVRVYQEVIANTHSAEALKRFLFSDQNS